MALYRLHWDLPGMAPPYTSPRDIREIESGEMERELEDAWERIELEREIESERLERECERLMEHIELEGERAVYDWRADDNIDNETHWYGPSGEGAERDGYWESEGEFVSW